MYLEKFKLSLLSAQLDIAYNTKDAIVTVTNSGNIKAQNIQIQLAIPKSFDVQELVVSFIISQRKDVTVRDILVVRYTIEGLASGESYSLDVFGGPDRSENPLLEDVKIEVTCDNCNQAKRFP